MDYEIEVWIVPLDDDFEPITEKALIRSATCNTNLDELMSRGQKFLMDLPEADNHTTWS